MMNIVITTVVTTEAMTIRTKSNVAENNERRSALKKRFVLKRLHMIPLIHK